MTDFDPIEFLERAVATPSHESIEDMRSLVIEELGDQGIETSVHESGTVLARRGAPDGSTVVLNTHLDTVAPHVPFKRDGSTIRGRGACDAKGPLAAMLSAFLRADVGDGSCVLALTPDEEAQSRGAHELVSSGALAAANAVIVGEPTGLDVCTAAKGRYEVLVTLEGESAHAATPGEGTSAVQALRPALAAIETFDDETATHTDLGQPTLTATTVTGGDATNQVPAHARLVLDRRPVPPETVEEFRTELTAQLERAVPAGVSVTVSFGDRPTPFLEAWSTPTDEPVVDALQRAGAGDCRPFGAATEASYFADLAPTVVFGPGDLADEAGPVAHSDREYVDGPAVREAASILEESVTSLYR